jgi:hypothetical protein
MLNLSRYYYRELLVNLYAISGPLLYIRIINTLTSTLALTFTRP